MSLNFNGNNIGGIPSGGGTPYILPIASEDTLGGVKIDGETITITNEGVISSQGGGTTDHYQLSNLDFAHSGHTGFAKDDASNLTAVGKSTVAEQALPGTTQETLIFEPDSNPYSKGFTKTVSGYYNASGEVKSGASTGFLYMQNTSSGITSQCSGLTGASMNCHIPAYKNETVIISMWNATSIVIKFVPLRGE